jgi:hypothetical protein
LLVSFLSSIASHAPSLSTPLSELLNILSISTMSYSAAFKNAGKIANQPAATKADTGRRQAPQQAAAAAAAPAASSAPAAAAATAFVPLPAPNSASAAAAQLKGDNQPRSSVAPSGDASCRSQPVKNYAAAASASAGGSGQQTQQVKKSVTIVNKPSPTGAAAAGRIQQTVPPTVSSVPVLSSISAAAAAPAASFIPSSAVNDDTDSLFRRAQQLGLPSMQQLHQLLGQAIASTVSAAAGSGQQAEQRQPAKGMPIPAVHTGNAGSQQLGH